MKKTYPLRALLASLLCLCALAFSSCSGDDDDNPASGGRKDPALVGTWMTSDGSWGYTFRADGSSVNYEGAEVYPGTWNTRDGMLLVYWDEPEPEVYTSYSIRGNALYLTDEYGDSYILYKEQSGTPGSGSDENTPSGPTTDPDIVGTWIAADGNSRLTFGPDGHFWSSDVDDLSFGTYEATGGKLSLVFTSEGMQTSRCSYTISADRLTITYPDGSQGIFRRTQDDTSGSGGEDTPGTAEDIDPDLVGTWRVLDFDAALTFRADGTCIISEGGESAGGTWYIRDGKLYQYEYGDPYPSVYTYSVSRNRLTLTGEEGESITLTRS